MSNSLSTLNDHDVNITVKGKDVLHLSLRNSGVRIREKVSNKGIVRKMKIYIDLSKEEAEGYKSFMEMIKPESLSEQDFIKTIFLKGVEAVNTQITEEAKKYFSEHPEMLNASGSPTSSKIEVL
jgi:hypothetical protein